MSEKSNHIPLYIVSTSQDPRNIFIKATFQNHFLEMTYSRRETPDGFLWFGKLAIDANPVWESPRMFGCQTREILDGEIQHQLFSWALRQGYVRRTN